MKQMSILISVYNISGYLMAEVAALLDKGADVCIIETPCRISDVAHKEFAGIDWINRKTIKDAQGLEKALKRVPSIFLCCGWNDKVCCKLARLLRDKGVTTVIGVDNPWATTARQIAHCLISRFYLTKVFDFGWGAGKPQSQYLRYLGFPSNRILEGFYAADTKKFATLYREGRTRWPHNFIYVGRYVQDKNMRRMESGFLKALVKMPANDWVLRCIGSGDLWDERTIHPRIEHLGYKSPSELHAFVQDGGCFVLASTNEHWGVVVHEFALMGLPMICSDRVMATQAFLKEGINGYLFDPYDEDSIAACFCKMMQLSDEALSRMGRSSHELGLGYTTTDWADRLLSMRRTCNETV